MAEPFLSEIRVFSFGFPPKGWAQCNGQLLPINQNQALFSLLGTTYGGDGRVNFGLPDLRGRTPIHEGAAHTLGERAGAESHTLILSQLPSHEHLVMGLPGAGDAANPTGSALAQGLNVYSQGAPTTTLHPSAAKSAGGSQAHENMQPFLTLNLCIALQGIFPSQT
jgi:microcystin-dependent protein